MADPRFHTKAEAKSLAQLADLAGAKVADGADATIMVEDVAPLDQAGPGQLSFLDNVKYKEIFAKTRAAACVVAPQMAAHAPKGVQLLLSDNPYKSYALIAQAFYPKTEEGQISEAAHIDPSAQIGKGTTVAAGAVIGKNVVIGEGCDIGANSVISHALIGDNVRVYPGVCIGQDGFGFAIDPAGHVKVPQLGRVIIEDHVEIGANTCIDRGSGPDTVIGAGTWIDNLVQIAHNVKVGKGCVIIAGAGIAGSTVLEDYVVIAAQAGVAGHLKIGMGAQIGAQAGVIHDIGPGEKHLGSPSFPVKQFFRQVAALKRLTNTQKSE